MLRSLIPVPLLLAASLAIPLAAQDAAPAAAPAAQPAQAQQPGSYTGRILMRSKKAKTISVEVGKGDKAETFTLRHDDATKGLENAVADLHAIVITALRDGEEVVVEVKPKIAPIPEGIANLDTAAVKALIAGAKPFMLIDSRPRSRWLQAHLPKSVSIPEDELKEKGAAALLPADKSLPLVFYCGGVTCGLSTASAKLAREAGHTAVSVYQDGEPVWSKAGNPTYAATAFIAEDNIILIDLRDPAVAAKGAIARAISIPSAGIATAAEETLPVRAPIVLYGEDDAQGMAAREILLKNEFKKVSLVEGGYAGWKAAGGAIVTGALPTTVAWKRKPVKGEVDLAAFQKAVAGDRAGIVLLDVRGAVEIAEGTVPGALNIPLDQLAKRAAEVPKGQKIYVFCNSGSRAEMAVKALAKLGHDARFLVADIDCEDGKCSFSE